MVNVLISGALGRMGKKVKEAIEQNKEKVTALCGVDIKENFEDKNFPVYKDFDSVKEKADVIIDFSSPSNLSGILSYAVKNNVNAVLCTTGYTKEDLDSIEKASEKIAIFRSANMSVGINLLINLIKTATSQLENYDIEIIEAHHNKKKDAPSGTALMLFDAVKSVDDKKYAVNGRNGITGERNKNEVGINAIRGGNIVGEHEIMFIGENETVTLSHTAFDRSVFAEGAVKAAVYLSEKKHGIFNMQNLIGE